MYQSNEQVVELEPRTGEEVWYRLGTLAGSVGAWAGGLYFSPPLVWSWWPLWLGSALLGAGALLRRGPARHAPLLLGVVYHFVLLLLLGLLALLVGLG